MDHTAQQLFVEERRSCVVASPASNLLLIPGASRQVWRHLRGNLSGASNHDKVASDLCKQWCLLRASTKVLFARRTFSPSKLKAIIPERSYSVCATTGICQRRSHLASGGENDGCLQRYGSHCKEETRQGVTSKFCWSTRSVCRELQQRHLVEKHSHLTYFTICSDMSNEKCLDSIFWWGNRRYKVGRTGFPESAQSHIN